MHKVLLTIAARGGSKGVLDKNIKDLCGKPLLAHSIEQAKRWGKADRIICTTDSSKIADVAKQYGADVPFMRPAELATDTSGKIAVLQHALKTLAEQGENYDIVVDLDPSAPIRTMEDINGAYELFCSKRPDLVISATPCRKNPYFNMVELGADGLVRLAKTPVKPLVRRQDAPVIYDLNASIYIYRASFLANENTKTALDGKTMAWVMDEKSAFDIDTQEDFDFVEYMTNKGMVHL
jgi:CMP-N,N'-diacetyllegionaminic acid synthase